MTIPYIRQFEFTYGQAEKISPYVRRLVANNPGPFTAWGTNVYLVGSGELVVIDPGPDTDQHFETLLKAIKPAKVSAVFVTHHHMDHSPMAPRLAAHFGCKTHGFGSSKRNKNDDTDQLEAGVDTRFCPDIRVRDGQVFTGDTWQIKCIHTPGHTSNHMCYLVEPDNGLICGDHVMAWATSVVLPPDGNMRDYLASLAKVQHLHPAALWPGHGPAVTDVQPFLTAYIQHRAMRDAQILAQLQQGQNKIKQMVKNIYTDIDPRLYPAAGYSVLAHLIGLAETGQVKCSKTPTINSRFDLV
ncbi:MBL-fold metallo-hydrolase superfamily [hydrothermal vent metagenome]|uniref:MBL-fold metallo-hydrolase superfamily n=1 Tax=hydrothermal vent metagenome TaxID=652676 RepID=A0A3B0RG71_9ZZZZ